MSDSTRPTSGTEQPTLTFDESAAGTAVRAFGWSTDENGVIVDRSGSPVKATDGEEIRIGELAGVVGEAGDRTPLRDDFVSMVDHVKQRSRETDTDRSGEGSDR